MSTRHQVAFAIKQSAAQFWREHYPEALEILKTADTQYAHDAGYICKWRGFIDWPYEQVLHEAIGALKDTDYHLVVLGETPEDIYADGRWDYFKITVRYSLTFEGDYWWA